MSAPVHSASRPTYSASPSQRPVVKKKKKNGGLIALLIVICAIALALLVAVALLLVPRLKKADDRAVEDDAPVVESTKKPAVKEDTPTAEPAKPAATEQPVEAPVPGRKVLPDTEKMPALKAGEIVFWGSASCQGADEVTVRFILSADRKTIHHLRICATNVKSKSSTLSKVTISTENTNEVTFPGVTADLSLGECHLYELTFDDEDNAHVRLKFVFKQPSFGGTSGTTVELPEVTLRLEAVDLP